MNFFSNFNKNTGALAVLLCSFFLNLGEGKAQVAKWQFIDAYEDTIIISVEQPGGVCGKPEVVVDNSTDSPTLERIRSLASKAIPFNGQPNYFRGNSIDDQEGFEIIFEFHGKISRNPFFGTRVNTVTVDFQTGFSSTGLFEGNIRPFITLNPLVTSPQPNVQIIRLRNRFNRSALSSLLETTICQNLVIRAKSLNDPNFNEPVGVLPRFIIPLVIPGILPGQAEVPILGTTVQPQIPYLVLHAPPGDGSSSEFQETKTTCREFVNTYAQDGSNSANIDVKLGVAGSLGFIATVDYEFSVTFSAGGSKGDVEVKTTSNQTCVTTSAGFSTGAMIGNGGGDVFVGYGTDLAYGIYKRFIIDPNTCKGKLDTSLIYAPTGEPREFGYTEEAIRAEIIREKAKAENPAFSVRARNEAQNQADVWEKVLAQNNANKNNPKNALIETLSFSDGVTTKRATNITVLETNSLEVEHYTEFNAGISSVVQIGGSGVSGGYEYRGSYRYGKTNNSSSAADTTVSYTLYDDDDGDKFDVKVVRDPMFGTPVFRVEPTSKSSCPYQGGYQRDQPKLKHINTTNDQITITGASLNLDAAAIFQIQICNSSNDAREYLLQLDDESNPNGARVFTSGFELNVPRKYLIPKNSCQTITTEVKRLSVNSALAYPNLELKLYAECEKDISSSIFASVFFGNTTGVNDLADNSLLSVSPNPTSGWLQISLPTGNNLEYVRVMDLAGKTVRNLKLGAAASNTQIDLSGLSKGIYTLQARAEGQVFVKKVIVQ